MRRRHEDEIRVVCRDEKDWDPCHGERCSQIHHSLTGLSSCSADGKDDVGFMGYGDLVAEVLWKRRDEGLEDMVGP